MKQLMFILVAIYPINLYAQYSGGFTPSFSKFIAAEGSKALISTKFNWSTANPKQSSPPKIKYKCAPGITLLKIDNLYLGGAGWYGTDSLTLVINLDTPGCFFTTMVIPGVIALYDSLHSLGRFDCGGVFYDTNSIHRPTFRLVPQTVDSLIFPPSLIGDTEKKYFSIGSTYLDKYRTFRQVNVLSSFMITDSIAFDYFGCVGGDVLTKFIPLASGHYIDTAFILDPLTNDTLPLVLIGDAFDAGVSEETAQPLKLYPNPCDCTLTLELLNGEPAEIEIRNLLGEEVYSSRMLGSKASIDCSGLLDGVYMASITSGSLRVVRKVVVAH